MWASGRVKRKKGEFEKNTPDFNHLQMTLLIQPVPPGLKAADWVKQGGLKDNVVKTFRLLESPITGKTVLKDKTKIGNHTGAWGKLEGKHRGAHRVVFAFTTVLRGDWYIWLAVGDGHTDAYKHLRKTVGQALKGIKFLDTTEPTRGPLAIASVPDFAGKRGDGLGKEKGYTLPGIRYEKPEWMAKIPAGSSLERELRWAGEGRTKDGKHYLYFDISHWPLDVQGPRKKPEEPIEKRMEQWTAGAGDEAKLSKKGKAPFFKRGNFGKGKGLTYKFTGHLGKIPFTEEGWVVQYKQNLLRFRMQYTGTPDELKKNKELKAMIKAAKKAVKYQK